MPIDLKLGGIVSAGTPLPEQDYLFQIEDVTLKNSEKGDSINAKIKMTVIEPVEHNGRPHTHNLNIQESTYPFVKAFLCKLYGLDDSEVDDVTFDESDMVGRRIIGTIKMNGQYANVVAWETA